ncbi:hypothetical protein [Vitreimonas flagellata]|uniref:hypothetical protein n=1 Tax=Vitreimonas flagellata TaxID=2560861 RepID=UPI001074F34A|nr:hypothetical protein [Vitreimonas flagellata]
MFASTSEVIQASNSARAAAATKIKDLLADNVDALPVLMLAKACGSTRSDFALEDLFPTDWCIACVENAYQIRMPRESLEDLGTKRISAVVDEHLKGRGFERDKRKISKSMLASFEEWKEFSDLPVETQNYAVTLFGKISSALGQEALKKA